MFKYLTAVFLMLCLAAPMLAQDDDMGGMAPPEPLDSPWFSWLEGNWKGTTTSAMGEATETHSYTIGLEGQFLLMSVESKSDAMTFVGRGALTLNPEGKVVGYWIDSFRSMSEGIGTLEGNKETMVWTDPNGKYTRVIEKVSDDKYVVNAKMEMNSGEVFESKGEFTRQKEMMSDKQ